MHTGPIIEKKKNNKKPTQTCTGTAFELDPHFRFFHVMLDTWTNISNIQLRYSEAQRA